jgi:hypothetical protein
MSTTFYSLFTNYFGVEPKKTNVFDASNYFGVEPHIENKEYSIFDFVMNSTGIMKVHFRKERCMRNVMVMLLASIVLCGCDTLRFAPKEEQKQNAWLHWRTTQLAAQEAVNENTSAKVQRLTELSAQQSRAFAADYGMPKDSFAMGENMPTRAWAWHPLETQDGAWAWHPLETQDGAWAWHPLETQHGTHRKDLRQKQRLHKRRIGKALNGRMCGRRLMGWWNWGSGWPDFLAGHTGFGRRNFLNRLAINPKP